MARKAKIINDDMYAELKKKRFVLKQLEAQQSALEKDIETIEFNAIKNAEFQTGQWFWNKYDDDDRYVLITKVTKRGRGVLYCRVIEVCHFNYDHGKPIQVVYKDGEQIHIARITDLWTVRIEKQRYTTSELMSEIVPVSALDLLTQHGLIEEQIKRIADTRRVDAVIVDGKLCPILGAITDVFGVIG